MLLLASCTQDAGLDSANGTGSTDNTESNEGTISFTLGGAAGKTTTRATTTAAADDEKKITSLYAVLFRSTSTNAGSAANGTQNTETADDIFIKAVSLTATSTNVTTAYNAEAGTATFKAPTDNYQICFVANPGTELATAINSLELGVSTIKDFKALVETQAPDTKPMLMTSNFYTAKVTKSTAVELEVSMVRAMARIDVVNKANGITVTNITFKNRTVKTDIINDNNTTLKTDYLESTAKEYTSLALKGNSDGSSKYTETIYTYEQYGTGDNAPEMEITYTIDGQTGKTYKHTVKFEKTEGEEATTTTQINLKRNYLYTVILTNDADKLIVSLTVADWSEGTVFEVTNRKLIIGTDENRCDVALGDIMISNGKIVKPDALSTYLTSHTEAKAIGVVAYLYTDDSRIGNGVKTTLATNGVTAPCGLVLALKNANGGSTIYGWTASNSNATLGTSNYTKTLKALYYDDAIDGCEATKLALALADDKRPTMFDKVTAYRTDYSAPAKTTGWYIPSVGEWIDILGADGLGGADVSSIKSSDSDTKSISGVASAISSNLNAALAKAGTGNYDAISDEYWSSSELSDSKAYNMDLKSGSLQFKTFNKTSSFSHVRCILAF